MNTADLTRRLENLIRLGTIAQVDHANARCRVKSGGILTGWLPWIAERAGTDQAWHAPSVNEQCVLFSPSGEHTAGVVLIGLYSNAHPAPDASPTRHRRRYRDGAVIDYDTDSHTLLATLPAGGQITLTAPGGLTITGNVTINGQVVASGDVTAAGISLIEHLHSGVQPGPSATGKPQ
ncbi:baseplate assembly protein [Pseudomonas sp. PA15(2017)]|uniref:phage baseplate assembly protein V n=1 Tax=Pseudomonas sp. PA15(2017) TaxID=1932111 RepID=UPI0009693C3A|nr:phage baseplate assembly protein V [Pseudomonas sp. PA15(2017)]OLU22477.1 baseplate assembly protein [Pseudomonas sp. PA15(2017)]